MNKVLSFASLPGLRVRLFGGLFAGVTTHEGQHQAVIHLGVSGQALNHADATAWAEGLGGVLVSPAVYQLLNETVSDLLPEEWCWTSKLRGDDAAWFCMRNGFSNGDVLEAPGAAVAVLLVPLVA